MRDFDFGFDVVGASLLIRKYKHGATAVVKSVLGYFADGADPEPVRLIVNSPDLYRLAQKAHECLAERVGKSLTPDEVLLIEELGAVLDVIDGTEKLGVPA